MSVLMNALQVVCGGELRALLLRAPSLPAAPAQPMPPHAKVHTQVRMPRSMAAVDILK